MSASATTGLGMSAADLRQAVAASPIAMCVLDPDGVALFGNPAYAELLGRPLSIVRGLRAEDVFPADELPAAAACLEQLLSGAADRVQREYRMLRADGTLAHALTSTTVTRDEHGTLRYVVFQAFDLAELRAAEHQLGRRLAQQEAVATFGRRALGGDRTLDQLCDEAVALIADTLGVERVQVGELDPDRRTLRVRRGLPHELTGTRHEVAGTLVERLLESGAPVVVEAESDRPRTLVDHDLHSAVMVAIGDASSPFGAIGAYSSAARTFRADERVFLAAVANVLAHVVRREEQERELRRIALHDAATGLPNRPLLDDRLAQGLDQARANGTKVGVLFVDLDDFKAVNDAFGHHAGDAVLHAVGERLTSAVRPGDTVARFGGDEFVIVAGDLADAGAARELATAALHALAAPVVTRDVEHVVRASIGVRVADPQCARDLDAEALVRDADTAMYRAKARGGGQAEVLDDAARGRELDRLRLERDLRHALAHDELRLVFQPFARLRDGSWFGAETLIRWQHPEHGLLAPDRFLDVAERSGLIVPIGEWTLHEACRLGARWRPHCGEDFLITVNVSQRQLADPGLSSAVLSALGASGLAPRHLGLEITEQSLIADDPAIDEVLEQLSALGVQLLLDDFGTGFSSLSHLKRFPIDALKIDRSFIDTLAGDGTSASLVEAILGMAWAMGKFVIPEGIETLDQAAALRAHGCGLGQGYLYGRPLAARDFDAQAPERCSAVTARISATATPSRFAGAAQRVLSGLDAEMPGAGFYVGHLDADQDVVRFVGVRGGEDYATRAGDEIPLADSMCRLLVDRTAPALTGDADTTAYAATPMQQALGIRSYAGAPIWVHGQVVGTLCAVSRERDAFRPGDLRLLTFAAGMLGDVLADAGDDDVHEHLRRVPVA